MASVLIRPPLPGELDASPLGESEVPALTDHPAPQLGGVDSDGVVGPVADVGVGLGRRLHVGSDPPVPQEVDRRPQHGTDQLVRAHGRLVLGETQGGGHGRGHRNRLECPGEDASALGDQGAVVVVPRRLGQVEQPFPLGVGAGRVGVGVDEDVPVVERRDERDVLAAKHAVAEHVTRHVADPDDRERRRRQDRGRVDGSGPRPISTHRGR